MGERKSETQSIAELHVSMPIDERQVAEVALSMTAAKCIDAGMSDEDAERGFRAALRALRNRLRRKAVQ